MNRLEIRILGILLLLMPLVITISWTGLMVQFEYPDILREPVEVILYKYHESGMTVKMYWAGMVLSSLLIIPIVMLLYRLTSYTNRSLSLAAAGVGLASAIFHVIGFSRWLFAVDYLAAQYMGMDVVQKGTVDLIFTTLHLYLGVTIGETLGFITMGLWVILTAIALYRSGYFPKWAAFLSDLSGLGIMAGVLEWVGWSAAAEINAYAYQLWILIMAVVGIRFIIRGK